jgi:hypothetical protein
VSSDTVTTHLNRRRPPRPSCTGMPLRGACQDPLRGVSLICVSTLRLRVGASRRDDLTASKQAWAKTRAGKLDRA